MAQEKEHSSLHIRRKRGVYWHWSMVVRQGTLVLILLQSPLHHAVQHDLVMFPAAATDSNQDEPSACLANARDATRDFFSRHGDTPETGSEWRPAWNAVDTLNKRLTLGEQV